MGAPGAGKTTFAHGLTYELKMKSIETAFVPEYATGVMYENNIVKLNNQNYIYSKQQHHILRAMKTNNVIVTDGPLLHSLYYNVSDNKNFKAMVLQDHLTLWNLNIFLTRKHDYNPVNRFQDEVGAAAIHEGIESILQENVEYLKLDSTRENVMEVLRLIENKLHNGK